MRVKINIELPEPNKRPEYEYPSLAEKIKCYIRCCESDIDSEYHWNYLKSVYKKLVNRDQLPAELTDIFQELREFIIKHNSYDSGENQLDISGDQLFKHKT